MPEPVGAPTIVQAGLRGLCPRCGQPTLFGRHWLKFEPTCHACGLDIAAFNVGDGPAAFLTLILGTVIMGLAIWLELAVHPPLWVHLLIWLPVTFLGVVGSLRLAKAALLAAEYRNRAGQGQLKK